MNNQAQWVSYAAFTTCIAIRHVPTPHPYIYKATKQTPWQTLHLEGNVCDEGENLIGITILPPEILSKHDESPLIHSSYEGWHEVLLIMMMILYLKIPEKHGLSMTSLHHGILLSLDTSLWIPYFLFDLLTHVKSCLSLTRYLCTPFSIGIVLTFPYEDDYKYHPIMANSYKICEWPLDPSWIIVLIHFGLVTSYCIIELGKHWFG